jgi:hypothetical protein
MDDKDDAITTCGTRSVTPDRVDGWLRLRNQARYGQIDPRARFGDRKRLPQPPGGPVKRGNDDEQQ